MLVRARQRREALKTRLNEEHAVTGKKRNVENAENLLADGADDADDGG